MLKGARVAATARANLGINSATTDFPGMRRTQEFHRVNAALTGDTYGQVRFQRHETIRLIEPLVEFSYIRFSGRIDVIWIEVVRLTLRRLQARLGQAGVDRHRHRQTLRPS